MTNKIGIKFFLGFVLLFLWSCNEDLYVDPIRYSSVRGQVLYTTSRKPASKVLVRLSPSSRNTETDSSGFFRFDSVSAGKYTLQASLTGYLNEFAAIEIVDQGVTSVNILLRDDKSQSRPPTAPVAIKPLSGADSIQISPMLRWKSTDPDKGDTLTYDISLYQAGAIVATVSVTNQKADSLLVKNLAYNTVYTWQVVAKDGYNTVRSDLFSFRTKPIPDFAYAYVKQVNGQLQVFTSDSTTTSVQLTTQGSNWRPVVSPNRRQIAFISNRTTDLHLYVMTRDGQNQQRVTTLPLAGVIPTDLSFCWSPDGTQLVYPVNDKLYLVRSDGTGLRLLLKLNAGQFFSGCDWTSQGNQLVARVTTADTYVNYLMLVNLQTGTFRQLHAPTGRISNPVFSIDGKQVLFSQDISSFTNDQGRQLNTHIQLLALRDSTLTDVSGTKIAGTNDLEPRFAPNGARIIFTNADNTGNGSPSVMSMRTSGQDRKLVVASSQMPYWL